MIIGSQFIEHLYSQGYYIEEQREFGIRDFGRKLKKLIPKDKINKVKDFIEDKYANSSLGTLEIKKREDSIRKSLSKRNKLAKEIGSNDKDSIFQNNEVESKLLTRSKDSKNFLVTEGVPYNRNIDISTPEKKQKALKYNIRPETQEELDEFNRSNDVILYRKDQGGISSLAHEMGHTFNRRSSGKLKKIEDEWDSMARKVNNSIDNYASDQTIEPFKKRKHEASIMIKVEGNASKTGLKLLKESGANRKELKASKKQLNRALKHYKEGGKIYKNVSRVNKLRSLRKDKDDVLDITKY